MSQSVSNTLTLLNANKFDLKFRPKIMRQKLISMVERLRSVINYHSIYNTAIPNHKHLAHMIGALSGIVLSRFL